MITKTRHSKALLTAVIGLISVAIAIVVLIFLAPLSWQPTGSLIPNDPQKIALGEGLYQVHCAACHGVHLEGQTDWRTRKTDGRLPAPPHDESGHTWHHPDNVLFQMVKYGLTPPLAPEGYESDMPAFEHILSDQEIWAVLAFIRSSWSPEIQARQNRWNDSASQ